MLGEIPVLEMAQISDIFYCTITQIEEIDSCLRLTLGVPKVIEGAQAIEVVARLVVPTATFLKQRDVITAWFAKRDRQETKAVELALH